MDIFGAKGITYRLVEAHPPAPSFFSFFFDSLWSSSLSSEEGSGFQAVALISLSGRTATVGKSR